jgi:hypothetical protein
MGSGAGPDPLAGIAVTFANNTGLGFSSTDGDVTYNTPIPTGVNLTIAAVRLATRIPLTQRWSPLLPASIVAARATH